MSKAYRIDFKKVRAAVGIEEVLGRYEIALRRRAPDELVGPCPIHRGSNAAQFTVNTRKNVFHCFAAGCGASGNVLDLVARLEGRPIVDAAKLLMEWFPERFEPRAAGAPRPPRPTTGKGKKTVRPEPEPAPEETEAASPTTTDGPPPPLGWVLKSVDPSHPALKARGLTPATVVAFRVGYCSKGMMKGRIAIPIHNEGGELVGYAGRAVDCDPPEPRYLLPKGFPKAWALYNAHRALPEAKERGFLIVVEGYFGAMHVHQAGFPNVVALMGASLSEHQAKLIAGAAGRAVVLLDGDREGRKAAGEVAARLAPRLWTRIVHLPEERDQPDKLLPGELAALLADAGVPSPPPTNP